MLKTRILSYETLAPIHLLVAFTALALLSAVVGCVAPLPGTIVQWSGAEKAVSRSYVRKQDGPFSLLNVIDDGQHMYLEFDFVVPPTARFFDGDGRRITARHSKRVIALDGLHDSVLITMGARRYLIEALEEPSNVDPLRLVTTDDIKRLQQLQTTEPPLHKAFEKIQRRTFPEERVITNVEAASLQGANLLSNRVDRIEWRTPPPGDGATSQWPSEPNGREGYIRFEAGGLQPLGAAEPLAQLTNKALSQRGVLLLRAIVRPEADQTSTALAEKRTRYLAAVIESQGIADERVVIGRHRVVDADHSAELVDSDAVEISFLTR